MKILNAYSGIGGNRKHWNGKVTAVEKNPRIAEIYKRLYPEDEVIVADAHDYILEKCNEYDFIWSSPPCQSHSRMILSGTNRAPRYPDMKLYEEIIYLKNQYSGLYVVENVIPYYQAMLDYQRIGRHLFWSNIDLFWIADKNNNGLMDMSVKELKEWLDISYQGNVYVDGNHCPGQVLRNCVHPEIGRDIFNRVRENYEKTV